MHSLLRTARRGFGDIGVILPALLTLTVSACAASAEGSSPANLVVD
jgi:hypothetical protein